MSDEHALQLIAEKIIGNAQTHWLSGQHATRASWPKRERLPNLGKDGHPLMFNPGILKLMQHIAKYPYNEKDTQAFESDLAFFKVDFSVFSGQPIEYYDYLDVLSAQEFREWVEKAHDTIIANNSNWVSFVQNILEANNIDFSDLVQGKLSDAQNQLVGKIYEAILKTNAAETFDELMVNLFESEQFGVTTAMVQAHSNWRKATHKLEQIAEDSEQTIISGRVLPPHLFLDLHHTIKNVVFESPDFTSVEILSAIKSMRDIYEADSEVSAERTYVLMLGAARYLYDLVESNAVVHNKAEVQKALNEMVRIIAMDANPEPFRTVATLHSESLQRNGYEA